MFDLKGGKIKTNFFDKPQANLNCKQKQIFFRINRTKEDTKLRIMFLFKKKLKPRSLEIRLVTPSKVNNFFDLPQYSMNIATILGDDVMGDDVLSRGHGTYVVNSKSICELLTLYYYKISFLNYFLWVQIY